MTNNNNCLVRCRRVQILSLQRFVFDLRFEKSSKHLYGKQQDQIQSKMFEITDILSTVAIIIVIAMFVKFALLMRTRWKYQWALKDFVKHPREIFFLGHAKAFADGANGILYHFDSIYENNEKAMQAWVTPFNAGVVCYHPDTVKAVFNTTEPKDWTAYGFADEWLGDSLLLSSGRKWARNRRLLTPAFHFDILKPYVKVFADTTHVLVNKWKSLCKDGICSVEVMQDISLATLDSLMKCIMGVDDEVQGLGRDHPYINSNYVLTDQWLKRFGSLAYHSDIIYALSPDGYANRKAISIVHQFTDNVIAERKLSLQEEGNKDQFTGPNKHLLPFIDILLLAKDEDGVGLSDKDIRAEVDTFMFEGHDTTASGLTWILYNLANNPELQERCRKEVDTVMDDNDNIEWKDLSKLEYLTRFIKESMRLHSPVAFVSRRLKNEIQLPDGRIIPKGVGVYCNMSGVHHNPNVWKDPNVFDPDRFLPDNCKNRSSHAFVGFAAGPRNCIGQHFATSEMKVATAVILRNFRLTADTNKPVKPIVQTVLRSLTGVHVMMEALK